STSTDPLVGFDVPAMSLSSVDFPDPFAPTMPKVSPASTVNVTSFSASTVIGGAYWRSAHSFSVRLRSRRTRYVLDAWSARMAGRDRGRTEAGSGLGSERPQSLHVPKPSVWRDGFERVRAWEWVDGPSDVLPA